MSIWKNNLVQRKTSLEKSTQCSNNKVKSYALIMKHCLGYSCITKSKWSIDLNIQLGCFVSFFCLVFQTTISSISEDWSLWYKKAARLPHALVVQSIKHFRERHSAISFKRTISFYLLIPSSNVITFSSTSLQSIGFEILNMENTIIWWIQIWSTKTILCYVSSIWVSSKIQNQ